jgi:hypothetical protein
MHEKLKNRLFQSSDFRDLSPIRHLLHQTLVPPSGSLLAQAGITKTHDGMPEIHRISAFQVHRIHQRTPSQYTPAPWVCPICSDISRYRNSAPTIPIAKNSVTTFLHEDVAQSGHKNSVEQRSVCTMIYYQDLSPIEHLLHRTVGTPSGPLLREAGHHRNSS